MTATTRTAAARVPTVRVGFYDPFSVHANVATAMDAHAVLANLHWKGSASGPLRTMADLPVTFQEETPRQFDNSVLGPLAQVEDLSSTAQRNRVVDLVAVPFVRLILVTADSLDTYRTQARPLIVEWRKACVEKAHCPVDWYIIHVGDDSKAHSKVHDKLKTDFDTETDRRCFFMPTDSAPAEQQTEFWTIFSSKLKEAILSIFSTRLQILRNELKRITVDPKTHFQLLVHIKEAIATLFLMMNLFEEALEHFDLLSATISEHQGEMYSVQHWESDNVNMVEKYISTESLFHRDQQDVTLFALKSYIFTRIFKIFEALADSAPSLSLASLHIAEFLRRFQLFITETKNDIENGGSLFQVQEWGYKVIDEVMSLELCARLTASEDPDAETSQLSERCGEMLLLQRSKLLELGQPFGYHIEGVLTNLCLAAVSSKSDLSYEPLEKILDNQTGFEEHFVKLTETAIGHFNLCERPRSVDTLSIDIAILDYQNKQYEKAAIVLSTCPYFYGSQGWDVISITLLQAYIGCLEHLESNSTVFQEDGFSKQSQLIQSFVLLLTLAKDNLVPTGLITKAIDAINSNDYDHIVPFNQFLSLEANSYVEPLQDDLYGLSVRITNPFPISVKLNTLKLALENVSGDTVEFSLDTITLEPKESEIVLTTGVIQSGSFTLSTFSARFGCTELSHMFEERDKSEVYIINHLDNLSLSITNSSEIKLGSRPISVKINIPTKISNVKLKLWRLNESMTLSPNCSIKSIEETQEVITEDNCINIPELEARDHEFIMGFSTPVNAKSSNKIEVYASLSYEVNGSARCHTTKRFIDTSLSIGVSVQDIFKVNSLYCKFSIGTSEAEHPIRLISAVLAPNEHYNVLEPLKPGPLVAYGEQPANYFFQISSKEGVHPSDEESLTLTVYYREVKREARQAWSAYLLKELKKSSLERYLPFLELCSEAIDFDLNAFIMDRTLLGRVPNTYHQSLFKAIEPIFRLALLNVFDHCLKTPFVIERDFKFEDNKLTIDVLIPVPEVIHNVALTLLDNSTHILVGQEVEATLHLNSVVKGYKKKKESNGKRHVQFDGDQSAINKYCVEVMNNQENWLINGKTRHVIELDRTKRETHEFEDITLSLIPLRAGKILLPKIKIENMNIGSKNESLMEIDYKNDNEAIFVVSQNGA